MVASQAWRGQEFAVKFDVVINKNANYIGRLEIIRQILEKNSPLAYGNEI